ncbi:Leucine-rich repeat 3 [Sesbania bispinosa]|nr:Leucine-rich repeat 3 [Sesbania bispinosa]
MPNLRLISFEAFNQDFKRIHSVYLPRGLDLLPKNLRYFGWDGYPLKSLPSTFCPEMLVELSLPYSNVKKLWNGVQNLPNLEMLDLNGSRHLRECPNLSRAPNLKYVKLSNCVKLPSVDPSIFSLQKLKVLNVGGCMSLKSLGSKTCSPSLQGLYAWGCYNLQEFSVTLMPTTTRLCLNLGGSGLNELPSSILQIKNLENFSFPISDGLMDLPENFAPKITLSGSGKHERDTFFTLHKVLPSPGFRSTRCLVFDFCHNLSALPDNISLLSSLQYLILVDSAIISLPESLKYLPRLKLLEVNGCKILRSIPTLPRSIQCFHVWNCESLQTVLSSTSEPSEKSKCTFMLPNCIKLGLHSYNTILKDAIARIEHGAKQLATLLKNKEDASLDHDDDEVLCTSRSGKICYFLPAISDKIRDWFHYHSTQSLVTVELPSNLLGFAYYLVLSQVQSCHIGGYGSFGSKCYLETSWGESIYITSFFVDENTLLNPDTSFELMSDHVLLWYDAQCCKKIMEVVKERKAINDMSTTYNPKLTFIFFAKTQYDEVVVIKECGIRWIYPLEDQIVKEGGRCKSKRSREIYELETNNVVQNRAERSQEENVPPTKKLKQHVFRTPSNQQVDQEMEDLRCLLEELLHIEFGRDRM